MTVAAPGVAISAAVMSIDNPPEMGSNVAVRTLPFHLTTDTDSKPVPSRLSLNPGPPAATVAGMNPTIFGNGWGVIRKGTEFDVPPPGGGVTTWMMA